MFGKQKNGLEKVSLGDLQIAYARFETQRNCYLKEARQLQKNSVCFAESEERLYSAALAYERKCIAIKRLISLKEDSMSLGHSGNIFSHVDAGVLEAFSDELKIREEVASMTVDDLLKVLTK